MQLNIQELIAFAGTLPPQFADMQLKHKGPALKIAQPQLAAAPSSLTQNAQGARTVQLSMFDHAAQKDAAVLSEEKLRQKYGHAIADRAIAALKSQVPTAQQATMKYRRAIRSAAQEYGKDLRAAGVKPMQHSVEDFVHVIRTQQELQLNGENPSANEVLHLAYPNDPKKAERIGESKRMQRVQEAYDSPEIQNHPVEKAMIEHHGKRYMNIRMQGQKFSHSLSAGVVLFEGYDIATKLKAQVKEQGARISALEQQMECTKNREALADVGCTTSREKVLVLYDQGKRKTEIATLLGMSPNTVKSILQRSKKD